MISNKFISLFLVFSLILSTLPLDLFAKEAVHTELLAQMSLQQHYEEMVRIREQQKYDLQLELEILQTQALEGRIDESTTRRISQIQGQIEVVDRSLSSNEERLAQVDSEVQKIRQKAFEGSVGLDSETYSTVMGAANVGHTLNASSALGAIPGSFKAATTPVTGVVSTSGNQSVVIEKWSDGNFYKVSRYTDGPNKGKFAPGGREQLSSAEVKKYGSEIQANQTKMLQDGITQSQSRVSELKAELKAAKDPTVKAELKDRIDRQEKIQSELKSELKSAKSRPIMDFVKSGVSYAAMSVAITGGVNVISQLIENDGDLSRLDFGKAFEFITTEMFWAHTAGSFTGGMVGSALTAFLPGPFKVFGAIAGSAVGGQMATGGWRDADWAMIGAESLGSTIGFFIGAFVGSFLGPFAPIAIIGFSMAGSFLMQKLMNWVRTKFTPNITAANSEIAKEEEYMQIESWADMVLTQDLSQYLQKPDSTLREEMWIAYNEYKMLQETLSLQTSEEQRASIDNEARDAWTRYSFIKKVLNDRQGAVVSVMH